MNSVKKRKLSTMSEYQTESALAAQLPYWEFLQDTVILSDGTFASGFRLRGLAIETWDTNSINRLTAGLRAFLNSLPDGCEVSFMSEVDSDYRTTLEKHSALRGSNPDIAWVTESRLKELHAEMTENLLLKPNLYCFVYRRFNPTSKEPLNFLKSFFVSAKSTLKLSEQDHEEALREIRQLTELVSERLEVNGVFCERLSGKELVTIVYSFLNPSRSTQMPAPEISSDYKSQEFFPEEVQKKPELHFPSPREQLCFSDLVLNYEEFKIGADYHRVITLKTLPEYTHASLVSRLMQLPFPHTINVHFQVPEQSKELSSLQARRRMAHSMSATQGGRASDLESEAKLQSTEELLREIINSGQKILYMQLSLLIRSKDLEKLDSYTKTVLSQMRELGGAEAISETVAGFNAWKTMLPLGTTKLLRPKRIKTDNAADFIPIYQPYQGSEEEQEKPVCLFRTRDQTLLAFDPFNSRLPNYNTLVTGSSGAGKSFINNLVLLQYMTQKPLIYIIDIGGSYRKLCEFLGGQYIEISPPRADEKCLKINPFHLPNPNEEPSPQKIKFLIAFLENILTDTAEERLPKLDKAMLEEEILGLYKRKKTPTLSDLYHSLETSTTERLRQFSKMLFPWTGERPYGRLLDGDQGLNVESEMVVFDLKGLSSYPDLQSVMLLIITDFILGRVESKDPDIQLRRKQILMDECWELLKSQASSLFMEYCVRTLRKSGSGITFITQGLEEIIASNSGSAILSNTAAKWILLQRGDLEPIRKILKLNEQEMALISSLKQVKGRYSEAFLMANDAKSVVRACPTPIEYWLATSDATDAAMLAKYREKFPALRLKDIIEKLAHDFPSGSQGKSI